MSADGHSRQRYLCSIGCATTTGGYEPCPALVTERARAERAEAALAGHCETCDGQGDPKFYTARTKRAVNSLTVERGPKGGAA